MTNLNTWWNILKYRQTPWKMPLHKHMTCCKTLHRKKKKNHFGINQPITKQRTEIWPFAPNTLMCFSPHCIGAPLLWRTWTCRWSHNSSQVVNRPTTAYVPDRSRKSPFAPPGGASVDPWDHWWLSHPKWDLHGVAHCPGTTFGVPPRFREAHRLGFMTIWSFSEQNCFNFG